MKVLALVYPGMTLLDLVGPLQAWSFLPGYEFSTPGTVPVQFPWTAASACRRPPVSRMLGVILMSFLSAAVRSPHWTCWAIPPQSPF